MSEMVYFPVASSQTIMGLQQLVQGHYAVV